MSNKCIIWDYTDEDGNIIKKYIKPVDKTKNPFQVYWLDNEWVYSKPDGFVDYPYRVLNLMLAKKSVFLAEGEKCADTLYDLGIKPSSSFKNWSTDWNKYITGKNVVLFLDNDVAGESQAKMFWRKVGQLPNSIRFIRLEGLETGEDIYDYINKHEHTADEVKKIIIKSKSSELCKENYISKNVAPPPVVSWGTSEYGLGALKSLYKIVSSAKKGGRHHTLFKEVASVARLINTLDVDESELYQKAYDACEVNGLVDDPTENVDRTIKDAIICGRKLPATDFQYDENPLDFSKVFDNVF